MELLLRMIDFLSMAIEEADEDIEFLLKTKHPEAKKLMPVPGVGSITALSFALSPSQPAERQRDHGAVAPISDCDSAPPPPPPQQLSLFWSTLPSIPYVASATARE
jgi:hypothetical protein